MIFLCLLLCNSEIFRNFALMESKKDGIGGRRLVVPVSIRLSDELHNELCSISERYGIGRSAVIRAALIRFVSDVHEQKEGQSSQGDDVHESGG